MKPMALIGKKNPVLTQIALPVPQDEDMDRLGSLVERMLATCRVKGGIALAAPQVGVNKRIVVTYEGSVWINPVLELDEDEVATEAEGCLSLPGRVYAVERPLRCSLTAMSLYGWEEQTVDLENLEARVAMHEVDHLDGVLISARGKEVPNVGPSAMKF